MDTAQDFVQGAGIFVQCAIGGSHAYSQKAKDLTNAAKSLIVVVGLEGFEPSAN